MFKKLEIENFRGIERLEIEDLGNVNLLLGQNNSSKTSILEAIFLLIGFTNPELIIRIHNFRDFFLNEANDLSFIFRDLNFSNHIRIKAIANEKTDFREVEIKPSAASSNSQPKKVEIDIDNVSYDSAREQSKVNELSLNAVVKQQHSQQKKATSKLTFSKGTFNLTQPNFSDDLRGVYVTPKLPLPSNLEKELETLIINKQHQELIVMLKLIDSRIEDISFGTNRMIYVDVGLNKLIPLNLLGDGLRRYLSILLAIYNAKEGIVLIDELENGLHFSTLTHLWDSIIKISNRFGVQIFVTTHNIETLKFLKKTLEKEDNKSFAHSIRSYTLRKLEKNHSAYKYDFSSFENAVEEGIELR